MVWNPLRASWSSRRLAPSPGSDDAALFVLVEPCSDLFQKLEDCDLARSSVRVGVVGPTVAPGSGLGDWNFGLLLQLPPHLGYCRLDESGPPTDFTVRPIWVGAQEPTGKRSPVAQGERTSMARIQGKGQGMEVFAFGNLQYGHADLFEAEFLSGSVSMEAVNQ
jgi:hypothetical protein